MRAAVTRDRLESFMREMGKRCRGTGTIYLVGGATAVAYGWRSSTIDIDLRLIPDSDELFRAITELKEALQINVELASPADFIPELPDWEDRSPFVAKEGSLVFRHYDPYSQALAKIERGHARDLADVRAMAEAGLIDPTRLLPFFASIEPALFRFPAIDPASFRAAVERVVAEIGKGGHV